MSTDPILPCRLLFTDLAAACSLPSWFETGSGKSPMLSVPSDIRDGAIERNLRALRVDFRFFHLDWTMKDGMAGDLICQVSPE